MAHCAGCQGLLAKTTAANKLCKPRQDQSTHTGTHRWNICFTHTCTHTHSDALVCTFQSSFATFICISSKVAEQNCCIRWLRLSCGLPSAGLAKRNMQMPHKCSSSNSPNASAVPRPLCNAALSVALSHFTSHFACARV